VAFWGFVLSFVFITAWSVAAGMNVAVAIGMWVAYLVIAIALTRIVVEGGLIFLQGPMPLSIIAQFTGSGSGSIMGASTIVPGSMVEMAIMGDTRGFLMPSFMQSFKLAHDRKIKAKPLFALIMAVSLTTLIVSVWMNVRLGYEVGALSLDRVVCQSPRGYSSNWRTTSDHAREFARDSDNMDGCRSRVDIWDDGSAQPLSVVSVPSPWLFGECRLSDDQHVVFYLLGMAV
jgi:hypothetical protein